MDSGKHLVERFSGNPQPSVRPPDVPNSAQNTRNREQGWSTEGILQLTRENLELREELVRLRTENADLRTSAAIWIRCYEAARQRCHPR